MSSPNTSPSSSSDRASSDRASSVRASAVRAARGPGVISALCWIGAGLLLYRTAEITVVDGVQGALGIEASRPLVEYVVGAVGGVLLAVAAGLARVLAGRRAGDAPAAARFTAGLGILALGVAVLALLFLHDAAVGTVDQAFGRPGQGTADGEAVLLVAAFVMVAAGSAVVLREVAAFRRRTR